MSHFAVLVAVNGKSLDDVMLPYHEYESTGIEKYIEKVYISEKDLETMMKYYNDETDKPPLDEFADDWGGYKKDENGYYRMTNPNSKWDWFSVGGRYSDRLHLKNGHKADFAKKRDIDMDAMHKRRIEIAENEWDTVERILARIYVSMSEFINADREHRGVIIDKLRELEYDGDPNDDKAFDDFYLLSFFEPMGNTRDEHIRVASKEAFVFAFVDLDGKWHEEGSMGWWGIVSDADKSSFDDDFNQFIDNIPEDTDLYVVDCHI